MDTGNGRGSAYGATIRAVSNVKPPTFLEDQVARLRAKVEKQVQQLDEAQAALAAAEAELAAQEREN